ncbi:unnamed protein product, partial [Oikopleura dioica]
VKHANESIHQQPSMRYAALFYILRSDAFTDLQKN